MVFEHVLGLSLHVLPKFCFVFPGLPVDSLETGNCIIEVSNGFLQKGDLLLELAIL